MLTSFRLAGSGSVAVNQVDNRFIELAPDKTRWVSDNTFKFTGFMRIVGLVFRGAFCKQSLKYMQDFKAFVEEGVSVNA